MATSGVPFGVQRPTATRATKATIARTEEILLLYIQKVLDFEQQLPSDTQEELAKGSKGAFPGSPGSNQSIGYHRKLMVVT